MLKILVTNDDGVLADGIKILTDALKTIDNVHVDVIAPHINASGVSSSISLQHPLRAKQIDNGFWYINGTPTDCIKLGLSNFFDYTHDLVISGINHGENMGDDVIYSGTVGAAIEGRYLKHPPIAISSLGSDKFSLQQAAKVAVNLVQNLIKNPITHTPDSPYILNVNVPAKLQNPNSKYTVTQIGLRYFAPTLPPVSDARGTPVYWLGPSGEQQACNPGSDFYATKNNQVSITPLHIDLTAHHRKNSLKKWLECSTTEQATPNQATPNQATTKHSQNIENPTSQPTLETQKIKN